MQADCAHLESQGCSFYLQLAMNANTLSNIGLRWNFCRLDTKITKNGDDFFGVKWVS